MTEEMITIEKNDVSKFMSLQSRFFNDYDNVYLTVIVK